MNKTCRLNRIFMVCVAGCIGLLLKPADATAQNLYNDSTHLLIHHSGVYSKSHLKLQVDTAFPLVAPKQKPRPWVALAENIGTNIFFHIATRYIANEDYAHVSWKSIKKNFQTGFIWDNDNFKTNLFSHPYQGNLYYNTARVNGLNFWQSAPYALLGSAVWEFFGETQPPSTNDIFSTTFGGIGIGEATYRISSLILDGSATGFRRAMLEIAAAMVNPVRGVNRLARGECWRRGPRYVDEEARVPFSFYAELGARRLSNNSLHRHSGQEYMGMLNVGITYNNPFDIDGGKPFQYFAARLSFNIGSKSQALLSSAAFRASIWGKEKDYKSGSQLFVGIFQNYHFYNSEVLNKTMTEVPYRIAETVSYGPGALLYLPFDKQKLNVVFQAYVSGIVLGGAACDYYLFQDRDYNLGSGYSAAGIMMVNYRNFHLQLRHEQYQIFTWKGYENKDYTDIDPNYLNVQGAEGNARLAVTKARIAYRIKQHFEVGAEAVWYRRVSQYKYFPMVKSNAMQYSLGVSYYI